MQLQLLQSVLCCYAKKAIYLAGMLFHHHHQHHQHHQHHHHHHHHRRHFIPFSRGRRFLLLDPIPVVSGRRQGTPWTSCQHITGPSGAIWGSVSRSRTLRHAAQISPEGARSWTSDLSITSRPALPTDLQLPPLCSLYLKMKIENIMSLI